MANANGRAVPARVRSATGSEVAGAADRGVPARRGKAPGAQGGGTSPSGHSSATSAKRSKYGNRRVEYKGMTFDSVREFRRYQGLEVLQARGDISQLRCQVSFEIAPGVVINGRRRPPLRYVADFVYLESGAAKETIEDVKGKVTEGYRIKRHLMAALGFVIKEIR
ncbi:DUF1064 domain-containing protein [Ralstonia holmesii]